MPASTRMPAAARRDQLLDATAAIVIDRGFHRLSVESVSQSAGVTRSLVYQHFPDLDALLEALVAREMSRALAQVEETALEPLDHGDARELMLASLGSFLSIVESNPTTWRFVLMPPRARRGACARASPADAMKWSRAWPTLCDRRCAPRTMPVTRRSPPASCPPSQTPTPDWCSQTGIAFRRSDCSTTRAGGCTTPVPSSRRERAPSGDAGALEGSSRSRPGRESGHVESPADRGPRT